MRTLFFWIIFGVSLLAAVLGSVPRSELKAAESARLLLARQTPEAPPIAPNSASPQTPPPAPANAPMTVVLDPAHGGADSGARGTISEKDIVLAMTREIRNELQRQGYRAVMTRDSDSDPSYDDRAALANATTGAVFISLHVGSSGPLGSVRVYYYRLATPFTLPPFPVSSAPNTASTGGAPSQAPSQNTLTPWRDAQRSFNATSQSLASLLQTALAAQFAGSPANASAAAVRELRSVAGPAIAIEISNISVSNPAKIGSMAPQLTSAIVQSLASFRNMGGAASGAPR